MHCFRNCFAFFRDDVALFRDDDLTNGIRIHLLPLSADANLMKNETGGPSPVSFLCTQQQRADLIHFKCIVRAAEIAVQRDGFALVDE